MKMSLPGVPASLDEAPHQRLYQRLARRLFAELAGGKFAIGDRLPAERELALEHGVSRPAVREAMIALEVQGLIEVRVGSGAYVLKLPRNDDHPGFAITAFELTEARLVFEGESAALAAAQITDDEIMALERLIDEIAVENQQPEVNETADREFHLTIARASGNSGVVAVIDQLWRLRATSPECALLHRKAWNANVRPVVDEHRAVLDALRSRDPAAARAAMRAHLAAVMDHLLFATEEKAMQDARKSLAGTRARYARAASL